MIKEISRLSDLDVDGKAVVLKAMDDFAVTFYNLSDEIAARVSDVPPETAKESANWYPMAHEFANSLSNAYGVSIEVAAGVISAVSPRMPWLRNKTIAETIIAETVKADSSIKSLELASQLALGLKSNVTMAIEIVRHDGPWNILTGIKRKSFYNNIVAPNTNDSVTVDTWMMESYVNVTGKAKSDALKFIRANDKTNSLKGTGAGYFAIAEAVRHVARDLNWMPNAVQAVYWCALAGSVNGGRTDIGGE